MSDGNENATRGKGMSRVTGELAAMSSWKKKLLALFLVIGAAGAAMRAPAWFEEFTAADSAPVAAENADPDPAVQPPPGARGFVDSSRMRTSGENTAPASAEEEESAKSLPWNAELGGWLAKLGLSFAGGLVLGVFFRAFLKTMAAITALAIAAIVGLSYFEVINVDFTTMRQNYDGAAEWISAQGEWLKDAAMGVLPSLGAAGVGFFFGFIRR